MNSHEFTDDDIGRLMKVLWSVSENTRIILTSGTGAIPKIAKKIQDSRFLIRRANDAWSTPNIVQVATHLPGFLRDQGDIRDSISIAHALVSADTDVR
jgi:hypothetical protein